MKLSVSHPDLNMIRFEIDQTVIDHEQQNYEYVVNISQAAEIKIFFEPWKISPFIRIDDHLIDYWLANVMQYDHMIQLHWSDNFYCDYQNRNIQSKIQYLGLTKQEDIDYYLGINNSNLDIVDQIKKYLE
jgi:hypothetical protein